LTVREIRQTQQNFDASKKACTVEVEVYGVSKVQFEGDEEDAQVRRRDLRDATTPPPRVARA
jgi:hypothetical protein